MGNKELVKENNDIFSLTFSQISLENNYFYGYISPNGEFYPSINKDMDFSEGLLLHSLKDESLRQAYLFCRGESMLKKNSHLLELIIDYYLVGHLKYYKFDINNISTDLKSVTKEQQTIINKLLNIYYTSCGNYKTTYLNTPLVARPFQLMKNQ